MKHKQSMKDQLKNLLGLTLSNVISTRDGIRFEFRNDESRYFFFSATCCRAVFQQKVLFFAPRKIGFPISVEEGIFEQDGQLENAEEFKEVFLERVLSHARLYRTGDITLFFSDDATLHFIFDAPNSDFLLWGITPACSFAKLPESIYLIKQKTKIYSYALQHKE